jgi:hypothetical protein
MAILLAASVIPAATHRRPARGLHRHLLPRAAAGVCGLLVVGRRILFVAERLARHTRQMEDLRLATRWPSGWPRRWPCSRASAGRGSPSRPACCSASSGRRRRVLYRLGFAAAWRGCFGAAPEPMEVMKQLRQQQIREIVERPIRTQHELAAALRERGFRGHPGDGQPRRGRAGPGQGRPRRGSAYALPPRVGQPASERRGAPAPTCSRACRSRCAEAGLLLVVRTVPGSAHAIAAALDRSAGRRSSARSPATTPCSSPSPIAARWSAFARACAAAAGAAANHLRRAAGCPGARQHIV